MCEINGTSAVRALSNAAAASPCIHTAAIMLMVNWIEVPVDLSMVPAPKPPYGPPAKYQEAYCNQRVWKGRNFVRPRPRTPPPKPSLAIQRKLLEAKRRLRLKMRLNAKAGGRIHAHVQYEVQDEPAVPETRSYAVQHNAAQTDFPPGYSLNDVGVVIVKTVTGLEASTQVCDIDLTDFETEYNMMASSLVSSVLNQSIVCVMYENDETAFRHEQNVYKFKLLTQFLQLNRLKSTEADNRYRARLELEWAERTSPARVYRTINARALAAYCMADVTGRALRQLETVGYVHADYQMTGWLSTRIGDHCRHRADCESHLDALIGDVIVNRRQVQNRMRPDTAGKPRNHAVQPESNNDGVISLRG